MAKGKKKFSRIKDKQTPHTILQKLPPKTTPSLLNKRIFFVYGIKKNPCLFLEKTSNFLELSSVLFNEVHDILNDKYQIKYLLENDKDAVISRIPHVQNHENQI